MKCLSIFALAVIFTVTYSANAKPKPFIGIDTGIPFPLPGVPAQVPGVPGQLPGMPRIPGMPGQEPTESETPKPDSSKEVETMDKSESAYIGFGYYPYYYGWPNYGYHYPYVYVGK